VGPYFAWDYTGEPFHLFGLPHLVTLAIVALGTIGLIVFRRRFSPRARRNWRYGMAALLVANEVAGHLWYWAVGVWSITFMLPLHMCSLFVWLTALETGMTPDDTVLDTPIRLGNWSPANFEPRFAGEVSLEDALAHSINTASVRLLLAAGGPRPVIAVAHRLGIAGQLPNNASLALGTGEVGLLELTSAYAAFFNGGARVTPFGIETVQIGDRTNDAGRTAPQTVLDPDRAAMMARMLTAVVARGTGQAASIPGRMVAGKTGTTQDFRDAWFIGRVDGLIIGVWLGNDDGQPMRNVTGGSLPARLFREIATTAR